MSMVQTPTENAQRYDVVVVGGGINGTSTARELAAAGFHVLLLDKGDFANGASSRSSRILHCGLRYFETHHPVRTFALDPLRLLRALRMASAAMQAREELARTQPTRCKPFTMCFPLYREGQVRGWHLDLGFQILNRLGSAKLPLAYRRLTKDFEAHLPFVRDLRDRDALAAVATYREYIIDWPDRLCVDAALDAERHGAVIRPFCELQLGHRGPDGSWTLVLKDRKEDDRSETVSAPIVLNMAGTWTDDVNGLLSNNKRPSRLIKATKGAHIVVRLPDSYRGFGIATLHRGGMPFYCLPLHDNYFYFGPTETPYEGDAADAAATDEEIDFLLGEANFMLPGLRLTRRDVGFSWAGVRPLTFDLKQPMGRRTREIHDLSKHGLPGVLAMTAGPVMTHLSAGREMRRAVEKRLTPARRTRSRAQVAAAKNRATAAGGWDMSANTEAAFRNAVLNEHARDLKGILYTRTAFAWGRHIERQDVERAAHIVANLLDWSPERTAREVEQFLNHQARMFRTVSRDLMNKQTAIVKQ